MDLMDDWAAKSRFLKLFTRNCRKLVELKNISAFDKFPLNDKSEREYIFIIKIYFQNERVSLWKAVDGKICILFN